MTNNNTSAETISPLTVRGPDGVTRSLSEHYDGQKDVEQDPYGAWLAIQNLSARVAELEAENAELRARVEKAEAMAVALKVITEHYVRLANSGDAGFWEPEDETQVKMARAALAAYADRAKETQ
jgi:hypothetical protein